MARSLTLLVTPWLLLAGGWLIFYVLKEPPPLVGCMSGPAPGVEEYRRGLGAYGTLSAALVGGLIATVSRGPRTLYALGICAWLAALYNFDDGLFQWHATLALVLTIFGGELVTLFAAIGMFAMRRPRIAELTYLWMVLLLLLPVAITVPAEEGIATFCLD